MAGLSTLSARVFALSAIVWVGAGFCFQSFALETIQEPTQEPTQGPIEAPSIPDLEGSIPTDTPDRQAQDAPAQPDTPPGNPTVTNAARLRDAVMRIDPGAELLPNGATFSVQGVRVTMVYDINADRMRLVTPVAEISDIGTDDLFRLMQANFDSALDARYALGQGVLWSTFLHPLSTLTLDDFASGIGQTVNLVATYGTTYSSGIIVFGGGDSAEQQRQLIDELQDKSKEI